MNFTYENQGTFTYLVYKIDEADEVDSMSLGMLVNNNIQGFAQMIFTQMDREQFLKYNVSSKVSVSQFFDGVVNKKRLLGVFGSVVNGIISAEEYMLDMNTILLDLDYIFMDVSSCEAILICLPIEKTEKEVVDLRSFFRNIMFKTQFDQSENCDYVAKIISYLNGNTIFSLMDFKKIIDNELTQQHSQTHVQSKVSAPVNQPVQPNVVPQMSVPVQPSIVPQMSVPVQPNVVQQMNASMQPNVVPAYATPQNVHPHVAVPEHSTTPVKMNRAEPQTIAKEDKMSLFYLLQHYNKDNAAIYKDQKEKVNKTSKKKNIQSTMPDANQGFAIPGQVPVMAPATPVQQMKQPQAAPSAQTNPSLAQVKPNQPVQMSTQNNVPNMQGIDNNTPAYTPRNMNTGPGMNFGETTVLNGGNIGETTVLHASTNAEQQAIPYLIRVKTSERIMLNKPVFRIGKEKSYVDYFIGDNTAVSRSHANIISRENEYYVVDTNSTNHTFVNGSMIQSNMEIAITHGDKLRFSNEEFEFNFY